MHYLPRSFQYPRGVYQFLVSDMLFESSVTVISLFLAVLLLDNVPGTTLKDVGIVIAVYQLAKAAAGLPSTFFTHRMSPIGKQRLVSLLFVLKGLLLLIMGGTYSLIPFILTYGALGIFEGVSYPLRWALFTNLLVRKNQETAWSLEDLTTAVAAAAASLIAGSLATVFGISILWMFFGSLFILNGLLFMTIRFRR